MKLSYSVFLRLSLLLFIVVGLLAYPGTAYAVSINGVEPSTVSRDSSAQLVISGSDFLEGAVVTLEGYGALTTTFVSATVLTAQLPGGLGTGTYTVSVLNPDGSWSSLSAALTVVEPTDEPSDEDSTPTPFVRPLVIVESYKSGVESITPGQDFELTIRLQNVGGRDAVNVIASFAPGDFVPRVSGGVLAKAEMEPGEHKRFEQPFTATREIAGKTVATVVMQLTYTDENGASYTETFNLSLPVKPWSGIYATQTPTATATTVPRPQMIIEQYTTDTELLKPGSRFNVEIEAKNVGSGTAKRLTMILGGGSSSTGGASGTAEPGGVSGGGGEFGNFAPVSASNVHYLGELASGDSTRVKTTLIVNASTNPGAYPMKISFTYVADNGNTYTDDQVITLLVYSPPNVEVNFYRDPGEFFAGQPNLLPLQVVNLGRKPVVLGNMTVSGLGAQYSNNMTLVGALDTGSYYTLDATMIPEAPGPLDVQVRIDYTDDFNESQVITRTVHVEVQEMVAPPEPAPGEPGATPGDGGGGGTVDPSTSETFIQKAWRFLRGLAGLDSAPSTPAPPAVEPLPGEEQPGKPIQVPAGGKG